MKFNGYSKNGKTWYKSNDDLVNMLNIQSNKWNLTVKPVEVFTNYGVYSPASYRYRFKSDVIPKLPKERLRHK